ncbi:hypothetical protein M1N65_00375, partial [Thermodesulfovibrionales bacterium]|nr:hypothetical protein [Thermodesulfovibrionales bacterium]
MGVIKVPKVFEVPKVYKKGSSLLLAFVEFCSDAFRLFLQFAILAFPGLDTLRSTTYRTVITDP